MKSSQGNRYVVESVDIVSCTRSGLIGVRGKSFHRKPFPKQTDRLLAQSGPIRGSVIGFSTLQCITACHLLVTPIFPLWTWPDSVHTCHMSHPVNLRSKWYSMRCPPWAQRNQDMTSMCSRRRLATGNGSYTIKLVHDRCHAVTCLWAFNAVTWVRSTYGANH